jgi:transcriptional regulator with XRE-family HTH domain
MLSEIVNLRKEKGLTIRQVASAVLLSPNVYEKYELGLEEKPEHIKKDILDYLGNVRNSSSSCT